MIKIKKEFKVVTIEPSGPAKSFWQKITARLIEHLIKNAMENVGVEGRVEVEQIREEEVDG